MHIYGNGSKGLSCNVAIFDTCIVPWHTRRYRDRYNAPLAMIKIRSAVNLGSADSLALVLQHSLLIPVRYRHYTKFSIFCPKKTNPKPFLPPTGNRCVPARTVNLCTTSNSSFFESMMCSFFTPKWGTYTSIWLTQLIWHLYEIVRYSYMTL